MRLTLMTDYALRLLIYVGRHPDRLCTISEVAGAYDISESHLMKITHLLGQAGFLETVRGKGGGMRLAMAPAKIGLGAVVRRLEPDFALVECLAADNRCVLTGQCRLAGILSEGLEGFLSHLGRYTLADLLPETPTSLPRMRIPVTLVRADAAPKTGPRTASKASKASEGAKGAKGAKAPRGSKASTTPVVSTEAKRSKSSQGAKRTTVANPPGTARASNARKRPKVPASASAATAGRTRTRARSASSN